MFHLHHNLFQQIPCLENINLSSSKIILKPWFEICVHDTKCYRISVTYNRSINVTSFLEVNFRSTDVPFLRILVEDEFLVYKIVSPSNTLVWKNFDCVIYDELHQCLCIILLDLLLQMLMWPLPQVHFFGCYLPFRFYFQH